MRSVAGTITDISLYTAQAVGVTLFTITHPIVGIAAQPILWIKLAVHSIALGYHWHCSKNEKGVAICNENYTHKYKKFKVSDLNRLEHEEKRL